MNMRPAKFIDEATAWREGVAAEVASRYGVSVRPEVISVHPMGASGLPQVIWDAKDNQLRYQTASNPFRTRGLKSSPSQAGSPKREPSESVLRNLDKVSRLHSAGMFDKAMVKQLGISLETIRKVRNHLGLESNSTKSIREQGERRLARILNMLRDGVPPQAVSDAEKLSVDCVKDMARVHLGVTWRQGEMVAVDPEGRSGPLRRRQAALQPLLAQGLTLGQIATQLNVAVSTIKTDLAQMGLSTAAAHAQKVAP